VARDAGSLKWSIMRGRRPWSLVSVLCAALIHVFASARPTGNSAMCQPHAGSWMTSDLGRSETISRCSARGCSLLAAYLPLTCRLLAAYGHLVVAWASGAI
jgi:hypothetical protein